MKEFKFTLNRFFKTFFGIRRAYFRKVLCLIFKPNEKDKQNPNVAGQNRFEPYCISIPSIFHNNFMDFFNCSFHTHVIPSSVFN